MLQLLDIARPKLLSLTASNHNRITHLESRNWLLLEVKSRLFSIQSRKANFNLSHLILEFDRILIFHDRPIPAASTEADRQNSVTALDLPSTSLEFARSPHLIVDRCREPSPGAPFPPQYPGRYHSFPPPNPHR